MNRIIDLLALCVAVGLFFTAYSAFLGMAKHPVLGGIVGGLACLLGVGALALTYRR